MTIEMSIMLVFVVVILCVIWDDLKPKNPF